MTADKRRIEPADIMPIADYTRRRKELRQARIATKKLRRLQVGPYATVLFENYASMLAQVQEMLYIEKGGDEQLVEEMAAYNPMIPQGSELTATMLLEIEDADQRARVLATLGRIEDHIAFRIGDDRVTGVADEDLERTNAAGKTSAVHFFHFPFTAEQIAAFRDPAVQVMFEISHPNYGHLAIINDVMRAELANDFD